MFFFIWKNNYKFILCVLHTGNFPEDSRRYNNVKMSPTSLIPRRLPYSYFLVFLFYYLRRQSLFKVTKIISERRSNELIWSTLDRWLFMFVRGIKSHPNALVYFHFELIFFQTWVFTCFLCFCKWYNFSFARTAWFTRAGYRFVDFDMSFFRVAISSILA